MNINPWVPPLVLLGAAFIVLLVGEPSDPVALGLASFSALIALTGAVQSAAHGLRPAAAAFYLFWFAWLGVGPIAQLTLGRVAWGDTRALADPAAVHLALVLTALAIACFSIGDLATRARASRPSLAARASIRPGVHALVVAALMLVGLNAVRVLGLDSLFASRTERGDALDAAGGSLSDAGGVVYALYTVLPSGLAIAATLLGLYRLQLAARSFARVHVHELGLFLVGFVGLILFANPLSQTRFIALLAFGALVLAALRPRTPGAGFVFLAVGAVATLLLYPLASAFRRGSFSAAEVTADTFASADFDGFQQVVNTLSYVQTHGLAAGHHLLSAVLFFVPRSVWPDKATIASADVATHAGYSFTNLSLPIHAELYLQFGGVGIIVGMVLLGMLASRVDSAWLHAPLSKWAMLAPLVSMAMFGVLRGPLGAQVPAYLPAILILLVAVRSGAPPTPGSDPVADYRVHPAGAR
ncbi:hypothetical protein [Microbacterium sp. zg-YB36]|uniref:hypothetical protein n=1 Tax=Microbacterium sp. zg-YB36 TaxID=2969407 RepID=UPI00214BD9BC|nr:hypothetical protein [Microbacterium sp. zg-YB36]MDL5352759.1 hypothetical protein [Microbacterium sp. zg-YB36]